MRRERKAILQVVVELPPQGRGRPRALLSDMVFAATYKVYSLFSSRRFSSDMREAHAKGYVSHPPHFNTICKLSG